ncbi:MAG: transposase [Bacteroidota bacterium]
MTESTALLPILQQHLPYNKARLRCLAAFVIALIKLRTVNLTQLALAINPNAKAASNYRRLQRFLALFAIKQQHIARLVLAMLPQQHTLTLALDRTNWKLGRTHVNFLVLAVCYRGLAMPLLWRTLGKAGNSNTDERISLIKELLKLVKTEQIALLVADREFIGQRWLAYLEEQQIPYLVRIRSNALIGSAERSRPASAVFASLGVGKKQVLKKKRRVYGQRVFIVGVRLKNDLLIVATNLSAKRAVAHVVAAAVAYSAMGWIIFGVCCSTLQGSTEPFDRPCDFCHVPRAAS